MCCKNSISLPAMVAWNSRDRLHKSGYVILSPRSTAKHSITVCVPRVLLSLYNPRFRTLKVKSRLSMVRLYFRLHFLVL